MIPKTSGFKMPAEWHEHQQCWMAWPCHQPSWQAIGLARARLAFTQVAKAIAQYEPVIMLVRPVDLADAKSYCQHANVSFISSPLNDSWLRDTGPTFLLNDASELAGVDWQHNAWGENYFDYALDNEIALRVINISKAKHFKAPLVMEGGAFHVDGQGTLLTTEECLLHPNRNPSLSKQAITQMLHDYLGTSHIIWLNQGLKDDETNGHVDEIACFIAPAQVLCLITNDKKDENYDLLQENLIRLQQAHDAHGRRLTVHTVQQPPATFLDDKRLTLSYTNFYLANQGIVMPAFGYQPYDEAAYQLFQTLYPHHHITQIHALDVCAGGGGIHCITQQQPLNHVKQQGYN